jgi:hypothetical protein
MTPERRITRCVKAILGLALFAVLGFSLAGCGGTKKIAGTVSLPLTAVAIPSANAPHTITVVGTTTIPKVKAGTWIKCKGWLGHGVKVPPLGGEANVGGGTASPNGVPPTSHQMRLNRSESGSLTVVCTSSG